MASRSLFSPLLLIAPLALAACTAQDKADNQTVPQATNAAENAAASVNAAAHAAAPAADLARYVGHYPFDKVGDHSWQDDPAVTQAVTAAVGDATVRKWIADGEGPATPIALIDGKVASWTCETHNCGPHQWITLIDPKSGAAEVCYYDEDVAADKVRWFIAGKEETRAGKCPEVNS
ncbi:hypothetical protein [Sphingobium sp. CAP-1]|uniref:hypothetical protein n=1 Tax=Sphingobium sp. CAP-1 TaxID=2676077 RepID=UPI0012BB216B|nr:hypothetical protein [Sphingobium sp. CAP-1]QGP79677.1 hypothetical protein GL174_12350 [Sphingobium sp. CAP-1]